MLRDMGGGWVTSVGGGGGDCSGFSGSSGIHQPSPSVFSLGA